MIVFDLLCGAGHRFEGWFNSAGDFSSQKKHKILECPTCGTAKVERVPSAARLNLGAQEPAKPAAAGVTGIGCLPLRLPCQPPLELGCV